MILTRSADFADISSSFDLRSKYHTNVQASYSNVTNVNMDYKILLVEAILRREIYFCSRMTLYQ